MIALPESVRQQGLTAARLMRLDRPYDLLFLLFFGLWVSWVASGGRPVPGDTLVFLLGATAARCAAWVFTDLGSARFSPTAPGSAVAEGGVDMLVALRLFALLCGIGFASAIYLHPYAVIASPLILALIMAYPWMRTRSYLSTLAPVGAFAWAAPMAWFAQGEIPGKVGWLVYLTGLFWGLAFVILQEHAQARTLAPTGIRSLALLGREALPLHIALLLAAALTAAGVAGGHAGWGTLFELGWLGAAVAAMAQVALLLRPQGQGLVRAYTLNGWFGFSLWAGTVAHYICTLSAKA